MGNTLDPGGLNLAFFHLLALIAGFGGSLFMIFFLQPAALESLDKDRYITLVAKVIRRFHPFLLLCYGVLIMTGAFMLTRYKIDAGVNYFHEYGAILICKLGLVFLAVMVACYQFFGLGTGIVYIVEEGLDRSEIPEKLKRMRYASYVNFGILVLITYLGLMLSRA